MLKDLQDFQHNFKLLKRSNGLTSNKKVSKLSLKSYKILSHIKKYPLGTSIWSNIQECHVGLQKYLIFFASQALIFHETFVSKFVLWSFMLQLQVFPTKPQHKNFPSIYAQSKVFHLQTFPPWLVLEQ